MAQILSSSRRILVQVGTRARPTGWVEREATFKGDDGKQTFHGKQVVATGADALGHRGYENHADREERRAPDGQCRSTRTEMPAAL